MDKPYTYTMPEKFLEDASVPTKWRLLAILNGFFISKGSFFGSNDWLMSQLDVSQQSISHAVTQLEKDGLISVERTITTRIISACKGTNELVGAYKLTCTPPTNELVPNSDNNNSDSIILKESPKRSNFKENILEHWNMHGIIVHRELSKDARTELGKLERSGYPEEDLKRYITLYATILKGDEFFWSYKWNLYEFLKRGLKKFEGKTVDDYRSETKKQPEVIKI